MLQAALKVVGYGAQIVEFVDIYAVVFQKYVVPKFTEIDQIFVLNKKETIVSFV